MSTLHRTRRILGLVVALAAVACGPSTSTQRGQFAVTLGSAPAQLQSGQYAIRVENPPSTVEQIWVYVAAVRAHSTSEGWIPVPEGRTGWLDVLSLRTDPAPLGLASLPADSKITQLRLVLSDDPDGKTPYVVVNGANEPLKVPSGYQSGIKIHGPWTLSACEKTTVTLDFKGDKSIFWHQASNGWILRPVIHTKKADRESVPCDAAPPTGGGTETPADACQSGTECSSGNCVFFGEGPGTCGPGHVGAACVSIDECLSGVCSGSTCGKGGPGAPCEDGSECESNACNVDHQCDPGTAVDPGTTCGTASECISNACEAGACEPGGQGATCRTDLHCLEGYRCVEYSCQSSI